jgi:hypothetical protein
MSKGRESWVEVSRVDALVCSSVDALRLRVGSRSRVQGLGFRIDE